MGWMEITTGLVRNAERENPALPTQSEETDAVGVPRLTEEAAMAGEATAAQAVAELDEAHARASAARDAGASATPGEVTGLEHGETPETLGAEQALGAQLLRAVNERVGRAEKSVLRSMAEQRGLPEERLADLLAKARSQDKPEPTPQEQQADTAEERLRRRLLQNEVARVGGEMGLLDADVALRLLEEGFAKVENDGEVTGVRESLESLRQRKGYLFAPTVRTAWAQRVGTAAPALAGGVEEAFYRKNPALRK